jgi:hypothetical protein
MPCGYHSGRALVFRAAVIVSALRSTTSECHAKLYGAILVRLRQKEPSEDRFFCMGDKHWANTLKHTVEQTLIESKRKNGLVDMVDDIFNQLDDFARQPPSQPKGRQVVKKGNQRRKNIKKKP